MTIQKVQLTKNSLLNLSGGNDEPSFPLSDALPNTEWQVLAEINR